MRLSAAAGPLFARQEWTPPHYGACVIHDGVRYGFWTEEGVGCDFGPI